MNNMLFRIFIFWVLFFCMSSFTIAEENKNDFSKRVKISLREVGNQLLLSNNDTLSLILPVIKKDDVSYQLSFKNQLSFEPNTLVSIIKNVFEKSSLSKDYIVEVLQCSNNEVAYSYEINKEIDTVLVTGEVNRELIVDKLNDLGYPEKGNNTLVRKAKSYVNCAIGRMTETN